MLVSPSERFVRTHFDNEAEIERVVQLYSRELFGDSIIYLPQTRIVTGGGRGSIPDAVVVDVENMTWYVVEAERAIHGTWEHIAPQVSRQLAAVSSPATLESILRAALDQVASDTRVKDIFRELNVGELEVHGRIQAVLRRPPVIAIPIDGIPKDLKDWVQTLRNEVRIWVLEKYVSTVDAAHTLYALPDENFPTITTTGQGTGAVATVRTTSSQPYQELLDALPSLLGQPVFIEYQPRGGTRRRFEGLLRPDGVEVDGEVYSLSYGAVHCLQSAGSSRTTANGWDHWKTVTGERLSDVYKRVVG